MVNRIAALGFIAMMLASTNAWAQINQPNVSASQSVKVLKAKSSNRTKNNEGQLGQLGDPCSQDLNAGNVIIPEGGRTPREVVIVIEGDVTNVGSMFGNARCRR